MTCCERPILKKIYEPTFFKWTQTPDRIFGSAKIWLENNWELLALRRVFRKKVPKKNLRTWAGKWLKSAAWKNNLDLKRINQGILNGEVSLYRWPPVDWFGISCMTTDNICVYLQNRLIQTRQTGGQQYSDTSPFSIPWINLGMQS